MIGVATLTQHQVGLTGNSCDNTRGSLPSEIAPRVSSTQSENGSADSLSGELASLARMYYTELHLMWRRQYRVIPPKRISRDILELGIAWKIQESKHGGLSGSAKRQVAELARTMETKSNRAKVRVITPKPGARLLRSWAGVTHDVMVVDEAFIWAGKRWRSLSAIARAITGTHWSGPRFFGLIAKTEPGPSTQKSKAPDHE